MKILSLSPCDDWYFVAKGTRDEDIVFKVAVWALTDSHEVIGLIAVSDAMSEQRVARLVEPPPIKGTYRTKDQLDGLQLNAAKL